ncbi:MAG: hypothetical protein CVU12_02105 [Bacteroidetes bacterium HGW-Bacteroidetes-7]|jgi:hypothetical protein|nr:MAG: hypothetical protein CVU12_02105 [Bacteroidetes bacterium HGW-Bacteroidetes-7]
MLRRRLLNKKGIDYSGAVVGDILCSDMTTVSRANYLASGKTAIGVIINNAYGVLRAMALSDGFKSFGGSGTDILGLTNYTTSDNALNDIDGKGNTLLIVNSLGNGTDHAAGYCANFTTAGTSVGDWHLGALGEFKMIVDNRATVNTSLTTVGGTLIVNVGTIRNYGSSTEYGGNHNWTYISSFGAYYEDAKTINKYIRPIIILTY